MLLLGSIVREPGPAGAIEPKAAAVELISLTNISRTSNGLHALLQDSRLNVVATERSEDMIRREYFSHSIPPNDTTVVDTLESLGVRFVAAGENIAWNTALDFGTVQGASEDFMNSPHHRQNLLDSRWNRLGAGAAQGGEKNRKMYTVLFLQVPSAAATTAAPAARAGPGTAAPVSSDAGGGSGAVFVSRDAVATPPPVPPPAADERGRAEVSVARAGLMDSLINRLLRLHLNF
jgi:hypothetical protein